MSDASLLLSPAELLELTGRRQGAAQARWLIKQGVPFVLRADGKPRVVRALLEARQGETPRRRTRPDFSSLEKAG